MDVRIITMSEQYSWLREEFDKAVKLKYGKWDEQVNKAGEQGREVNTPTYTQ